jgi:hypothetical protein
MIRKFCEYIFEITMFNPNVFRHLEGRLCSKESKKADDITTMTLTLTLTRFNVDGYVKIVADSKLSLPQSV